MGEAALDLVTAGKIDALFAALEPFVPVAGAAARAEVRERYDV